MSAPFQTLMRVFSGTSTIPTPQQSSSAQASPGEAVTAAQLIAPHPTDNGTSNLSTLEKWGIPLGGMLMTGIIGYYSAMIPLKDEINENKTEISIAKKEIENAQENIKRIEDDIKDIPDINTKIAVINEKLTHAKK